MVNLTESKTVNVSKLQMLGLLISKEHVDNALVLLKNIAKEKIIEELRNFTLDDLFSENSSQLFIIISKYFDYQTFGIIYFNFNGLNLDKFSCLTDTFIKDIAAEFKERYPNLITFPVVKKVDLINAYAYFINESILDLDNNIESEDYSIDRTNLYRIRNFLWSYTHLFNFTFTFFKSADNIKIRKNKFILNLCYERGINTILNKDIRAEVYSMILTNIEKVKTTLVSQFNSGNQSDAAYVSLNNKIENIDVIIVPQLTTFFRELERIKFNRTDVTI